jgi:transcriptional regulator with XRE-family HTH domain
MRNLESLTGAKIAHLRGLAKLSQTELAEKAQVSVGYISHIEKGAKIPSFKVIVQIAEALHVSWKDLTYSPLESKLAELNLNENQLKGLRGIFSDLAKVGR